MKGKGKLPEGFKPFGAKPWPMKGERTAKHKAKKKK